MVTKDIVHLFQESISSKSLMMFLLLRAFHGRTASFLAVITQTLWLEMKMGSMVTSSNNVLHPVTLLAAYVIWLILQQRNVRL